MMALSGVRSSWLMLARNFTFEALARSASARASFERLLLQLALGDVAHHRDHLGSSAAVGCRALEPPAAHLDPDELRSAGWTAASPS